MRLQRLCLTALALLAATTGSARADSDDTPTAVLGFETQGVPPRVGDEIVEYLRQNVANNHDLRLVPGKDLVELKLVFACADEAHACMALAGKSLNAEWLIYGSLKRVGDSFMVWLKLFDVKREKVTAWLTEPIPRERATGPALKANVARWFSRLRGRPAEVGTLRVSSEVQGAVLSLDGVVVGATTSKPFVLSEVGAGSHIVTLDKAGLGSTSKSVSVGAGEIVDTRLVFDHAQASPRAAQGSGARASEADLTAKEKDVEPSSPAHRYRVGFWVTLTAGLISAGAALKYGLDVSQVNQDLDPYRRHACPSGLCDLKGAPRGPLTESEASDAKRLMDKGNRAHDLQWVYVGVGSALGIASGYLLYKGYLDSETQTNEVARSAIAPHRGLRIFPTAGTSSGGVLAEFDF